MTMNLADVKSFDIGIFFYDMFRERISVCEKKQVKKLKEEINSYYQKSCKTLKEQDKQELYKIYSYLINALNERWSND